MDKWTYYGLLCGVPFTVGLFLPDIFGIVGGLLFGVPFAIGWALWLYQFHPKW